MICYFLTHFRCGIKGGLKRLQHLDLGNCSNITDETLRSLIGQQPQSDQISTCAPSRSQNGAPLDGSLESLESHKKSSHNEMDDNFKSHELKKRSCCGSSRIQSQNTSDRSISLSITPSIEHTENSKSCCSSKPGDVDMTTPKFTATSISQAEELSPNVKESPNSASSKIGESGGCNDGNCTLTSTSLPKNDNVLNDSVWGDLSSLSHCTSNQDKIQQAQILTQETVQHPSSIDEIIFPDGNSTEPNYQNETGTVIIDQMRFDNIEDLNQDVSTKLSEMPKNKEKTSHNMTENPLADFFISPDPSFTDIPLELCDFDCIDFCFKDSSPLTSLLENENCTDVKLHDKECKGSFQSGQFKAKKRQMCDGRKREEFHSLSSLVSLNLNSCFRITDDGLRLVLHSCQCLSTSLPLLLSLSFSFLCLSLFLRV